MASSFSEDECVRLFTLSLPESFQFFSVVACAIGSYYSTVAPWKRFASGLSSSPMSDMGQKRRFGRAPITSGLPQ
jgi:hypothetical protein